MPPRQPVLLLEEEGAGELEPDADQLGLLDQDRAERGDGLVEKLLALVGLGARGQLHGSHAYPEAGGGEILGKRGAAQGERYEDDRENAHDGSRRKPRPIRGRGRCSTLWVPPGFGTHPRGPQSTGTGGGAGEEPDPKPAPSWNALLPVHPRSITGGGGKGSGKGSIVRVGAGGAGGIEPASHTREVDRRVPGRRILVPVSHRVLRWRCRRRWRPINLPPTSRRCLPR